MRESDLYVPVRDYLKAQGYEIHVEVFDADIVAVKDGMITVVELKKCFSQQLLLQLIHRAMWADFVIGAIPTIPRDGEDGSYFSTYKASGFGLWIVRDGKIHKKIKHQKQPWGWHKAHAYRIKKLTGRNPAMDHEIAGMPSCRQLRENREIRNAEAITTGWINVIKNNQVPT